MSHVLLVVALYGSLAVGVQITARLVQRRLPGWVVAIGVVLPIVMMLPFLGPGRTPLPVDHALALPPWSRAAHRSPYNENLNDVITQIAPWQLAVRRAWREGELPLWNRWNGCGMPLAANGQSEAFSPLTFLTFPLPLAYAFALLALAKLFLSYCGMWLWLSEMSASPPAAVVGAILFAFSLGVTAWLLFPLSSVFCLWPWALFAFEVLREARRRRRGMILLGAVLSAWGLGHPETAALGAFLLLLWALLRESLEPSTHRRAVLVAFAIAAAAAVGVTAFQTIPEAFAIAASSRMRNSEALWRRLPFGLLPHGPLWKGYLTLLFPTSLGDGISTKALLRFSPAAFPETGLGHFGVVGWAAAIACLRPGSPRRPLVWILLGLVTVGAAVALGCWPFFEVFLHIPVIRLMSPLRYLSWVSLAGAALAALELDRLTRDLARSRLHLASLILILILLALAAWATFSFLSPHYQSVGDLATHRQTLKGTIVVLALAVLLSLIAGVMRRPRLITPLLGALAYLELARTGQRLYRVGSSADLFPQTPLLTFLSGQATPFRVLGEGAYLFPNANVFPALQEIRTHDPVERLAYTEYLNEVAGYDAKRYFKDIQNVDAAGLDRLNVKYLVSPPDRAAPSAKWRLVYSGADGRVFENTRVWPRIFDRNAGELPGDRLTVTHYSERANSVSFLAQVKGSAPVLAMASIVSDGGWHARTEPGKALSVGTVERTFLSIAIPPGTHRVVLRYSPPGFAAGAIASAGTMTVLVAAAGWRRRRKPWATESELVGRGRSESSAPPAPL